MARSIAVTSVLLLLALAHVTMSITVQEFFHIGETNLTTIKWAHRTNNQTALKKVLNSTDIHMIEADVTYGTLIGNTGEQKLNVTIMGHPPENSSDLSLADFVGQVLVNKTKGIKLDFKSIQAFQEGVKILQNISNLNEIPVWLNADILEGPVNASIGVNNKTVPVDPKQFLDGATKLNGTLLSIGWTTELEAPTNNETTANYTTAQIEKMKGLITKLNSSQSVTYPVRACFAANDVDGFKQLLNSTAKNNATLTIWSSEGDPVNVTKLNEFIKKIGVSKLYIDVPADLAAKLDLTGSSAVKNSLSAILVTMIVALFGSKLL